MCRNHKHRFAGLTFRAVLLAIASGVLWLLGPQGALAQAETPPPPVIYLTFDDGPSDYTQAILDVLARYNAKATFFVLGRHAAARPELIEAIAAAGHGLGVHSYNHPYLARVGWERFQAEVTATHAVLGARDQFCLRPPYGATSRNFYRFAGALGYTSVMWTVDPRDWARPGAQVIANTVVKRAQPNAIVVLHDGGGDRSQTAAALETLLPALTAQGYTFGALCRDGAPGAMAGVMPPGASGLTPSATTTPAALPAVLSMPTGQPVPDNNGILTPVAGATVQGQTAISGVAAHPAFQKWQLDLLLDGTQETFLALGETAQPAPGTLFTWDTTLYPNGAHTLRLRVVHEGLNYDEYFAPVIITNP